MLSLQLGCERGIAGGEARQHDSFVFIMPDAQLVRDAKRVHVQAAAPDAPGKGVQGCFDLAVFVSQRLHRYPPLSRNVSHPRDGAPGRRG